MNDLTQIPSPTLSIAYSATAELTVELAKVLALVAPISMTTEQQEIWLRAAVDALEGIRGVEVNAISAELRRSVTRPSQIVPEIAKLVAEKRARQSRMREYDQPAIPAPPVKLHIAERSRLSFTAEDWAELNEHLERVGATKRYRSDGTRYDA
jgi:hypothetical protein